MGNGEKILCPFLAPHSPFPIPHSLFFSCTFFLPAFRGVISVRIATSGLLSRLFAAVGFARHPSYSSPDCRPPRRMSVGIECDLAPRRGGIRARNRSAAPVLFPASARKRFR